MPPGAPVSNLRRTRAAPLPGIAALVRAKVQTPYLEVSHSDLGGLERMMHPIGSTSEAVKECVVDGRRDGGAGAGLKESWFPHK